MCVYFFLYLPPHKSFIIADALLQPRLAVVKFCTPLNFRTGKRGRNFMDRNLCSIAVHITYARFTEEHLPGTEKRKTFQSVVR